MLEQLPERLSSKIVIDPSGCWLWTASLRGGYGQFGVDGTTRAAHRVVYEMLVGAVPDGLELDHTCRVRSCVNPSHLEPVTHRENVLRGEGHGAVNARKTHCLHGHELDGVNVYRYGVGRHCKACAFRRAEEARAEVARNPVLGPPVSEAARRYAKAERHRQEADRLAQPCWDLAPETYGPAMPVFEMAAVRLGPPVSKEARRHAQLERSRARRQAERERRHEVTLAWFAARNPVVI